MANGSTFLDIPTRKGLWTAFGVIVVFLVLGAVLYCFADKGIPDYVAKVGDCFIQGAIISILFAILKGLIDGVGLQSFLRRKAPVSGEAAHPSE